MGGYKTRFMMKSQVSQRDAGLDEQPLGVGPVSNKPVATLKPLLGPTSHYPFPPGVARQLVGRLVSGTLNSAIEDQYNQYVIEG